MNLNSFKNVTGPWDLFWVQAWDVIEQVSTLFFCLQNEKLPFINSFNMVFLQVCHVLLGQLNNILPLSSSSTWKEHPQQPLKPEILMQFISGLCPI